MKTEETEREESPQYLSDTSYFGQKKFTQK